MKMFSTQIIYFAFIDKKVTFGRSTAGATVDIDLSLEGPAWKISRRQGVLKLRASGEFLISNEGRRPFFIDGKPVLAGSRSKLSNNCVLEVSHSLSNHYKVSKFILFSIA